MKALMYQFSLRSLLLVTTLVAVLCTVGFVLPDGVRMLVLAVGVAVLPGPLLTLAMLGSGEGRAFAVGALAAYAAWLVVLGLPASLWALQLYGSSVAWSLDAIRADYSLSTGLGPNVPGYLVATGLYLPWLCTLLAGCCSVWVYRGWTRQQAAETATLHRLLERVTS